MPRNPHSFRRVLAIYPTRRHFGFAVLEERGLLVDWGLGRLYSEHDDEFLFRFESLVRRYSPVKLIIDGEINPRRSGRVRRRLDAAATYAGDLGIAVHRITKDALARAFDGTKTKHQVAQSIALLFPELSGLLPPKRRAATYEAEVMAVFGAVSMLVAASA